MPDVLSASERAKKAAAACALDLVAPGMRLGLGTGSTAAWFVRLLGARARDERLDLVCVATSSQTAALAAECGLALSPLDDAAPLDLTIDGADEFDPDLNLLKGGGGALLQEKIVACASRRMIALSDPSKAVGQLGAFPLPVEIVRFGWRATQAAIEAHLADVGLGGREATLRLNRDAPFVTDEGHFILDLHLRRIEDPATLAAALTQIPGVVETGLFIGIADVAILGYENGATRLIEPLEDGARDGDLI